MVFDAARCVCAAPDAFVRPGRHFDVIVRRLQGARRPSRNIRAQGPGSRQHTAIVSGSYHDKGNSEGKAYECHDRLTDAGMKTGGTWQEVASHYSVPLKQ